MNALERLVSENAQLRKTVESYRARVAFLKSEVETMAELRRARANAEARYLALRKSVDLEFGQPLSGRAAVALVVSDSHLFRDGAWRVVCLEDPGVGDD